MNKKQTMVEEILRRIQTAGVVYADATDTCDETVTLHASEKFWERYPDGHCNSTFQESVEGMLSCLDEHSLERILNKDCIVPGMPFSKLWKAWGREGYFKCVPTILYHGGIPVLRVRHDSYLSWFRGAGFQNSYDLYCNGSNGYSGGTLANCERAITMPAALEELSITSETWNESNVVFRKAMALSYPFTACAEKNSFHAMLMNHTEVFEEFVNKTDSEVMHLDLDPKVTLEDIRIHASAAELEGPIVARLPLILHRVDSKGVESRWFFGMLLYSETGVQLCWSRGGEPHQMTICFPQWSSSYFEYEADGLNLGVDFPYYLAQRNYNYECWCDLSVTLLTLAGVPAGEYRCAPRYSREFDLMPTTLFPEEDYVYGRRDIWRKLWDLAQKYLGFEELSNALDTMSEESNS